MIEQFRFKTGSRITYDSNSWLLKSDYNKSVQFDMPSHLIKISTIGRNYEGEFVDAYLATFEYNSKNLVFRLFVNDVIVQQWFVETLSVYESLPDDGMNDVKLEFDINFGVSNE